MALGCGAAQVCMPGVMQLGSFFDPSFSSSAEAPICTPPQRRRCRPLLPVPLLLQDVVAVLLHREAPGP